MSERGKAIVRSYSAPSGTRVFDGSGTIYRAIVNFTPGSTVQIVDGELGAAPNMNSSIGSNVLHLGPFTSPSNFAFVVDYGPGAGIDHSLDIAATSNARATLVFE